jgi:phenol 2-monooxygenase (NADPH)
MGITYSGINSPVVRESAYGIWKAGYPCSDIRLTELTRCESKSLYSIVGYGKFLILAVGCHEGQFGAFPEPTTVLRILPTGGKTHHHGGYPTYLWDSSQNDESYIVLVRPDMYVGYVGTAEETVQYLDKIFIN